MLTAKEKGIRCYRFPAATVGCQELATEYCDLDYLDLTHVRKRQVSRCHKCSLLEHSTHVQTVTILRLFSRGQIKQYVETCAGELSRTLY